MTDPAAVGIVLISHSRALAEGAAELAARVSAADVAIVGVGGTEDGRLGTSLDSLARAVEKVAGDAGVVVIPDLGSSVLTTRSYLADTDVLPDDVAMVDTAFVEGAVAAAVAAGAGLVSLSRASQRPPRRRVMSASSDLVTETRIMLPADLHARPAEHVSQLATTFDADVELVTESRTARAISVPAVMGLGVVAGQELTVRARGPQAAEAVAAVSAALRAFDAA